MSIHRAPGLLQEQWAENAADIYEAKQARFQQAYVNLAAGFIFTIYEADNKEALVEQFEELGLPFEEMHEVQFSQSFEQMKQMLEQMGRV